MKKGFAKKRLARKFTAGWLLAVPLAACGAKAPADTSAILSASETPPGLSDEAASPRQEGMPNTAVHLSDLETESTPLDAGDLTRDEKLMGLVLGDAVARIKDGLAGNADAFSVAEQDLMIALGLNPQEPAAIYWMAIGRLCEARIADRRDQLALALMGLNDGIAARPDVAAFHYAKALVLYEQHDQSGALEEAEAAVAMAPDDNSFRLLLTRMLLNMRDYDNALGWLQVGAVIHPESFWMAYYTGVVLMAQQKDAEGREWLQRAESLASEKSDHKRAKMEQALLARAAEELAQMENGTMDVVSRSIEDALSDGPFIDDAETR
ncbi:MAG: hypothetical protein JXX14_22515 [Deltaproteobacteria bacterium]|nr:hypothetical protein [Deltaproteobacteria bacterium]